MEGNQKPENLALREEVWVGEIFWLVETIRQAQIRKLREKIMQGENSAWCKAWRAPTFKEGTKRTKKERTERQKESREAQDSNVLEADGCELGLQEERGQWCHVSHCCCFSLQIPSLNYQ